MKYISFEWDENKNQINIVKHGIDFEEAATVFYDEMAIVIGDTETFQGGGSDFIIFRI